MLFLLACSGPTPTVPVPTPVTPVPPPAPTADAADTQPPLVGLNVLVVLIDDLSNDRIERFGIEGSHAPQTPVIDSLANQGRVFRRAYASPVCSPTRASLLTGRLPFRTGIGVAIFDGDHHRLPDEERTLAEAFEGSGDWATGAFGKWHLTSLDDAGWELHPNHQGFDEYDGSMKNLNRFDFWLRTHNGNTTVSGNYATQATTNRARDWVADAPEPWFAYVAYHATHAPLHVPPPDWRYSELAEESATATLDVMVESVDLGVGRILAALPPEVRERTWVVVLGDNGTTPQAAVDPNSPEQAKSTLYEGGIRVPMIITGPGILPGDTEALANVTDLFPTLLELTGVTVEKDREIDGLSLVPILEDPAAQVRDHLYQELFTPNRGVAGDSGHGRTVVSRTHKLTVEPGAEPRFHRVFDDRLREQRIDVPDAADVAARAALEATLQQRIAQNEQAWAD